MIYNFFKIIRYFQLFGINRTMIKIISKIILNRKYNFKNDIWLNNNTINNNHKFVAIVGTGNFAFSNICYYLNKKYKYFLHSTYDLNIDKAITTCKYFNGNYATNNIEHIINDKNIQLVYIASNHSSHEEYASKLISYGKHVHIEKPHVVNNDQLSHLLLINKKYKAKIFLGFNRPRSNLFLQLKKLYDKEKGMAILNWFIIGHNIDKNNWYYKEEGGRILGNLCHWSDLTLNLIGLKNAFPCKIIPITKQNDKSNFVLNIVFQNTIYVTCTFSSLGETIEGVRESLNLQRGNLIANIEDFKVLKYYIKQKYNVLKSKYKDQGHKENIMNSYESVLFNNDGESEIYIKKTADLFLGIKEALDNNKEVIIN